MYMYSFLCVQGEIHVSDGSDGSDNDLSDEVDGVGLCVSLCMYCVPIVLLVVEVLL